MFDTAAVSDASFGPVLGEIERFVATLAPDEYAPSDLPTVLKRVTQAEKLCGSARLLLSRRAAELSSHERDGRSSAAKWLSEHSGDSVGRARRDLETANQLASVPQLEEALRAGDVSTVQAAVLAPAIKAAPESAADLLDTARNDPLNRLREHCQSVIAATRTEEEAIARDARLRARRHLHIGTTDEGAVSIRGELAPVDGAVVKNALDRLSRRMFEEARREGRRESHGAYLADALTALCRESDRPESAGSAPSVPRAEIVLHVSAEALRRGGLESGEVCEIEGVGPVPLATVNYLFGNAWTKLIVEKGVDVVAISHFGRSIPAHINTALSSLYPICAVPGCGITYGLERDHVVPVTDHGPTELDNLVKLCKRHHYLKTQRAGAITARPQDVGAVNLPDGGRLSGLGTLERRPPHVPACGRLPAVRAPRPALGRS